MSGSRLLRRTLSRLLHLWFRMSRGLTLGVRAAVLDGEGRVFLVRHTYMPGWQLPGGGVERGETALGALARELAEEAGLALAGPPVLHGIVHQGDVSPADHVLVYVVREVRTLATRRPALEIADRGFFPLSDLPPGTTAGTRARLAEIAAGAPAAPTWSASVPPG